MKRVLLISSISLLFLVVYSISCKKENISACGVTTPQENLPWLKSEIEMLFCQDVFKYIYEGVEYVVIADCDGSSDISETVYECSGKIVCHHGGIFPGGGGCSLPSSFWDYYDSKKILICRIRVNPL